MESHFQGKSTAYNQDYYDSLVECLNYKDTELYTATKATWKGQNDYWLNNGNNVDYLGVADNWGRGTNCGWKECEQNGTTIGRYNMFIYEPCNYASNIAYYRSVKKMCDYGERWSIGEE